MPRDAKEIAASLGSYSDAITGFAFAQNVAFSLALGTHDFAESTIRGGWLIPAIVLAASAFYAIMIHECHRKIDALLGPLVQNEEEEEEEEENKDADKATASIRHWQYAVIGIGTLISVFGIIMTHYGNAHPCERLWFPFVGR